MVDLKGFAEQQNLLGRKLVDKAIEVVSTPGEAGSVAFYDRVNSKLLTSAEVDAAEVLATVGPRTYGALTLDSFCAMVAEFAGRAKAAKLPEVVDARSERLAEDVQPSIFVFVSVDKIVAVLDEEVRDDTVSMDLATSTTWTLLKQLKSADGFKQGGIVDLLRRQMDATFVPHDIITRLRAIKFVNNSSGESTTQVGKASVSKSVQAELTGADALPEFIKVSAIVWDNVAVDDVPRTATVKCAFDVDLAEQKFFIRPIAGEIERHERKALEWLVGEVEKAMQQASVSAQVRVYAGEEEAE